MLCIGQTALPEKVNVAICNARFLASILETTAMAAMVVLLLYVLFGPPT
jgi:hypothetical protein